MKFQSFEEIVAWQKAQDLAVEIYKVFSSNKDFGFLNQIRDAVVSISNNIAEGYERSSTADFSRFLYYSLGSSSEVKSMVYLAQRLNYINEEQKNYLVNQTSEVSRIIKGLIKFLNK